MPKEPILDTTRPCYTSTGELANIIATDGPGAYPIAAYVGGKLMAFTKHGRKSTFKRSIMDLYNAQEVGSPETTNTVETVMARSIKELEVKIKSVRQQVHATRHEFRKDSKDLYKRVETIENLFRLLDPNYKDLLQSDEKTENGEDTSKGELF